MFITGTLTVMVLMNFRENEKSKKTGLAADGIVTVARLSQNYTLSGKQISSTSAVESGARCAGGTNNSAKYYRLDIDQALAMAVSRAEDDCGGVFVIERFNFFTGTQIRNNGITLTKCCPLVSTPASIRIKFDPPFGKMTVAVNGAVVYEEFTNIDIVVESTDGSKSRIVRIDGISGRIGILP